MSFPRKSCLQRKKIQFFGLKNWGLTCTLEQQIHVIDLYMGKYSTLWQKIAFFKSVSKDLKILHIYIKKYSKYNKIKLRKMKYFSI